MQEFMLPENVNKTYFGSLRYHTAILELLHYNSTAVFILYFYLSKHEIYKPLWW